MPTKSFWCYTSNGGHITHATAYQTTLTEYVDFIIAQGFQYAEKSSILFVCYVRYGLVVIEKLCSMTTFLLYTCRDLSFNRLENKIPDFGGLKNLTNM
jgi:hypothetical protein